MSDITEISAAKLPNLFIAGAPKCGTTTLYHHLKQHPEIYMSAQKEPWFFYPPSILTKAKIDRLFYPQDWPKYLALFESAGEQKYRGEATPSYIAHDETISLIAQHIKNPKFIFSLRNPAERYFSHYRMVLRKRADFKDSYRDFFKKNLDLYKMGGICPNLIMGLYGQRIKKYVEAFGAENVYVMIFERWTKNPQQELQKCFEFLQVSPFCVEEGLYHNLGVSESERVLHNGIKFWKKIRQTGVGQFLHKHEFHKPFKKLVVNLHRLKVAEETIQEQIIDFYREDVRALRILLQDPLIEWDRDFGAADLSSRESLRARQ